MLKQTLIVLLSVVMLFSVVGVAGAQGPDGDRPRGGRSGRGQLMSAALLREAAVQLNVTVRDLLADVEDEQTIGGVISANGGDVDAVSAAVKSRFITRLDTALENERIDQARYDELSAGIDEALVASLAAPVPQISRQRFGRANMGFGAEMLSVVAESLGLTRQEIAAELRAGKTIGVIISENGGDVEAIGNQIIAILIGLINEAVADDRLDEERAAALIGELETRVTEFLTRTERPQRGERGAGTGNRR